MTLVRTTIRAEMFPVKLDVDGPPDMWEATDDFSERSIGVLVGLKLPGKVRDYCKHSGDSKYFQYKDYTIVLIGEKTYAIRDFELRQVKEV